MNPCVLTALLVLVPLCASGQPTPSDFNPSHENTMSHLEAVGLVVEYDTNIESTGEAFREMRRMVEEYERTQYEENAGEEEAAEPDSGETELYPDKSAQLRSRVASRIGASDDIELRSTEGRKTASSDPVLRVEVENREHDLEDENWWRYHVTLTVRQEATLRSGQGMSVDTYSIAYSGERMATEKDVSFGWAQEALDAVLSRFLEDLEASKN